MHHSALGVAAFFALLPAALFAADPAPAAPPPIASAAQFESPTAVPALPPLDESKFAPVPAATTGLLSPGTAVFLPAGLAPDKLPPSFALLETPRIRRSLPDSWSLRPVFTTDGHRFRATFTLPADIDLYGGGEVTGPLRRNGTAITLWNTDNFGYGKDSGRRLYQSHPWILGLRPDGSAFGLLFDSTWKARLDLRSGVRFEAEGPAFPVLVIERPDPAAVLRALGELTGRIELPPLWALGYQQCRWSYYPDSRVREIAHEFRTRRLPCDVIWMDIHYMDGYRVFTFDPKRFPDPAGLNAHLHEQGFKTVWMIDPGVKVDANYSVYTAGRDRDLYVHTPDGQEYHGDVWPGPCAFPDYTMPAARAWWSDLTKTYVAQGIDGVWNDMNEPAVFKGPDGTMPEDNHHRGGDLLPPGPHRRYHNVYGLLMARATREGILAARPERRPFVLTRANFLGGHRYAATWTGDNTSTERDMKRSVPMSLTLGLSGQPFNGPDLGGFAGDATPELWSRWIGFGTLFPFARAHAAAGTKPKEPWVFGPAVEHTARLALERRYRLLPYLYTLFRESSIDGLPVMRPVFMAAPADLALRREEQAFLLGTDLLVIPAWAEKPALPPGDWPRITLVEGDLADPDQATLRLRPGAILPLGRVAQNTTEPLLDTPSLLVALDAKGRATGRLYEDTGDGYAYQKGQYRLTTFKARRSGNGEVRVVIDDTEGRLPRVRRAYTIHLLTPDAPPRTWTQTL